MTRVLVTGATGFVGRQIMRALAASDVALIPVVRSGTEGFFNTSRGVEWVVSSPDIFAEPEDWWVEQCQGVDLVIHAAWYAEPGKYLQAPQNMQCLTGSLTLAKGAAKAGVRRFVGIGTCFEYDLTQGVLSVRTPLNPLSPYAAAKAGLIGLTKSLALDEAAFGITVNAVSPGWIQTGSQTNTEAVQGLTTPIGRSGTAHEVAVVISGLADAQNGYLTGQNIVVDGGNSIAEERA